MNCRCDIGLVELLGGFVFVGSCVVLSLELLFGFYWNSE